MDIKISIEHKPEPAFHIGHFSLVSKLTSYWDLEFLILGRYDLP